jgi:hypothetical protein
LKCSSHSSVFVVEPTQDRSRDDSITKLIWCNGGDFLFRNLLLNTLMRSCYIEILDIGT